MNFPAAEADELHRRELARLRAFVTPRPEALRSMSAGELRIETALMFERIGHVLHTAPDAPELVTTIKERKFVTICANPADRAPTGSAGLRRLRDRVVAAGAERGFYLSVQGFTADAQHFAETAPVQLIDGPAFIRALQRSRKGELMPHSYQAMCRQCGEIVQHRLDSGEAKRCGNGHFVAPTIARAELIQPRPPASAPQRAAPKTGSRPCPASRRPHPGGTARPIKPGGMTAKAQRRRAIKAHNYRLRAQAIKQQASSS